MTVNREARADALAAVHLLAESGLKPAAVELTVVSDEFDCLGTLDLLAWTPTGDLVVVDHKTAGDPTGWKWRHLEYAVQMGVYAAGQPLVERDGEIVRATWEAVGLVPPNQDVGYVVHIHARHAVAKLLRVDLAAGRQLARRAIDIREVRRTRTVEVVR